MILDQDGERSLTVVGDPDQSIYGWRSAKDKIFELMAKDLEKEEKDLQIIHLAENYRSAGTIVSVADCILTQGIASFFLSLFMKGNHWSFFSIDQDRTQKTSFTNNPRGIPIVLLTTRNEKSQAELVAKEINRVIEGSKGLLEYKDVAILMRANHSSEQFERVLRAYEIPFKYVSSNLRDRGFLATNSTIVK